jgi:Na+-translocating ferredoxin:NAD+ oxidoreductase subunit B
MAQGRTLPSTQSLVARIDALLPQTQCTKCGYAGCEPYAQAVASGMAQINQCPPGGDALVRRLARLLATDYLPLDLVRGAEQARHVARIDEARCIGCTLCIQACPVDAIVGAAQQMHTVIVELCTGCDLCVAPCPVDCIAMTSATGSDTHWTRPRMDAARERFQRRNRRLAESAAERTARRAPRSSESKPSTALSSEQKRATIRAAVERVRARRARTRRTQP